MPFDLVWWVRQCHVIVCDVWPKFFFLPLFILYIVVYCGLVRFETGDTMFFTTKTIYGWHCLLYSGHFSGSRITSYEIPLNIFFMKWERNKKLDDREQRMFSKPTKLPGIVQNNCFLFSVKYGQLVYFLLLLDILVWKASSFSWCSRLIRVLVFRHSRALNSWVEY